jgi:hypothetical protein
MPQPWADEPFSLIPTSKLTKPTASNDAIYVADGSMYSDSILHGFKSPTGLAILPRKLSFSLLLNFKYDFADVENL